MPDAAGRVVPFELSHRPFNPRHEVTPSLNPTNDMKPSHPSFTSPCRLGLAGLALVVTATAQQSPAPAALEVSGDTIMLDPFVTRTDSDVGYLATATLAGSRFSTKLDETPSTISVLTGDFLRDIGAFDLTSALRYASNVEMNFDDDRAAVNGQQSVRTYQSYRVRGLASTVARNYFAWNLPADTYNVDRVEDSRGPNSVLFGIASPGGLINVMTKKAQLQRSTREVSVGYGSRDSHRATLDFNQVLTPGKLAFRVNAVHDRSNSFRNWAFTESRIADLTATLQATPRLRFTAEIEFGKLESNSPRTYTSYDSFLLWSRSGRPTFAAQAANAAVGIGRNSTAAASPRVTIIGNDGTVLGMRGTMTTTGNDETMITDRSIADDSINGNGPGANRFSSFRNFTGYLDYKLAGDTFLQLAYNHQEHRFDRYDPGQNASAIKGDPNRVLATGAANAYAGQLMFETGPYNRSTDDSRYDNFRATLSTQFDAKRWGRYQIGAYVEYSRTSILRDTSDEIWLDATTGRPAFNTATPESANNAVYRRRYVTEGDWASYHLDGPNRVGLPRNVTDPLTGRTLTAAFVGRSTAGINDLSDRTLTGMAVAQARYFSDRLILSGGLRRDEARQTQIGSKRDPVSNIIIHADGAADSLAGTAYTRDTNVNTKSGGLVFKVTPWLSLIGNYADNIQPVSGARGFVMPPSGEPGALAMAVAPEGVGKDAGVGLRLFDGRLVARAVYFETQSRYNSSTFSTATVDGNRRILDALRTAGRITQADYDKRTTIAGIGLFDYDATGFEFEVTVNPAKYLRIRANYSITDPIQSNIYPEWLAWDAQNVAWLATVNTAGVITSQSSRTIAQEVAAYQAEIAEATASDGLGTLGNRRHKVSLFARYDLGWMGWQGAFVGTGYRHQSKMFTGVNSTGDSRHGNSFGRADAMAGYTFSLKKKHLRYLTLQLDVQNVLNQHAPLVTRYLDDAGLIVKRLVVQSPITWQLSTKLQF
jgi:iron complex outermembrane receptor protein